MSMVGARVGRVMGEGREGCVSARARRRRRLGGGLAAARSRSFSADALIYRSDPRSSYGARSLAQTQRQTPPLPPADDTPTHTHCRQEPHVHAQPVHARRAQACDPRAAAPAAVEAQPRGPAVHAVGACALPAIHACSREALRV